MPNLQWSAHTQAKPDWLIYLTIVLRDRAVAATEEISEVLVETIHHPVLVGLRVIGRLHVFQCDDGATVQEIERHSFLPDNQCQLISSSDLLSLSL